MINTGKLELPSLSQVQPRGSAESSWLISHPSHRRAASSGRLPDLHLPQSYVSSASLNANTSRAGGLEPSNGGIHYSSSHPATYSNNNPGIGLRTPSPSPTSQYSAPPTHRLPGESEQHLEYGKSTQHIQPATQGFDNYSSNMNQQHQYLESQQSQLSGGQSYAPHSSTAGGMAQYSSYQQHQQPPVLQPSPSNYAQSPAYGQYGYPGGLASPQGPGHPVSSSMGSQMNSGLLPLPGKST